MLAELLSSLGVPEEKFASTCVLVDKLDKLPEDDVRAALLEAGLPADSADTLLKTLAVSDFAGLEAEDLLVNRSSRMILAELQQPLKVSMQQVEIRRVR